MMECSTTGCCDTSARRQAYDYEAADLRDEFSGANRAADDGGTSHPLISEGPLKIQAFSTLFVGSGGFKVQSSDAANPRNPLRNPPGSFLTPCCHASRLEYLPIQPVRLTPPKSLLPLPTQAVTSSLVMHS